VVFSLINGNDDGFDQLFLVIENAQQSEFQKELLVNLIEHSRDGNNYAKNFVRQL